MNLSRRRKIERASCETQQVIYSSTQQRHSPFVVSFHSTCGTHQFFEQLLGQILRNNLSLSLSFSPPFLGISPVVAVKRMCVTIGGHFVCSRTSFHRETFDLTFSFRKTSCGKQVATRLKKGPATN